jgi:hypothetical protein
MGLVSIKYGAVATAVIGVWIALGPAHSSLPLSRALVAGFLVIAPAVAIARLLPSMNRAAALIVAAAGSVAINTLVAQSMLSADLWSRHVGVIVVGVVATLVWLIPTPGRAKSRPRVTGGGA